MKQYYSITYSSPSHWEFFSVSLFLSSLLCRGENSSHLPPAPLPTWGRVKAYLLQVTTELKCRRGERRKRKAKKNHENHLQDYLTPIVIKKIPLFHLPKSPPMYAVCLLIYLLAHYRYTMGLCYKFITHVNFRSVTAEKI